MSHSRKKPILIVSIAVILIVLFGLGVYALDRAFNGKDKARQEEAKQIPKQVLMIGDYEYEVTHNLDCYLFMGTDDSGNEEAVGTKEYRGRMADFLLLYVMDKTDNTYGFLQINRDTMADVPYLNTDGDGEGDFRQQICTAHWYGSDPDMGCENTMFVTSELLGGLNIEGYYSIHMSDVKKLNRSIGGVRVTIDEDMTMVDPAMKKGATLTLTDEQAEKFVRARMEVGDGENLSRMKRQKQFMQAFITTAQDRIKEDPGFINQVYEQLESGAVTDIPENRVSAMVNSMHKCKYQGILQLKGTTELGDTMDDGILHTEFTADEDSIVEAVRTLCGIDDEHVVEIEWE